ncbi:MAG: APC family permease [Candidatus Dormibacteria bacterium]
MNTEHGRAAGASPPPTLAETGRQWEGFDSAGIRVAPDAELYEDYLETGEPILRVAYSESAILDREAPGMLRARRPHQPRTAAGRAVRAVRAAVLGTPLQTVQRAHETLSRLKALAVLSSDAISSVAYGPEQVLVVLVAAGAAATGLLLPIVLTILAVLVAVTVSYRQTIRAYPRGGGSYIVAKDNLGVIPGLVAAASLMTDYVLTVAVSISAGVAAVTSAYPALTPFTVPLGVVTILILILGNLRGIRESANIFALPTYLFIGAMYLMLGLGAAHYFLHGTQGIVPRPLPARTETLTGLAGIALVLRSFASGSSSLTGVEAISDGVIAFKPVQWRNARTTLTAMSLLLGSMLLGVTLLAHAFHLVPDPTGTPTVLSQLGVVAFGDGSAGYLFLQATTALILALAANTAFSDFPRLLYFLARDNYAPRQFQNLGDRLAFSNGIVVLGIAAAVAYIALGGDTSALIPLYAIGVFASFTLSQLGMVMRWRRLHERAFEDTGEHGRAGMHWRVGLAVNLVGAVMTAAVLVITSYSKFTEGAWIIVLIIPALVTLALLVHRHYASVPQRLETDMPLAPREVRPLAVVPVKGLDAITLQALALARRCSDRVVAVFVSDDGAAIESIRGQWAEWGNHVPLEVIESPYRSTVGTLLEYLDAVDQQRQSETLMVFLPEMVHTRWWHQLLHSQTALRLKAALLFRPGTVVVNVPYHIR